VPYDPNTGLWINPGPGVTWEYLPENYGTPGPDWRGHQTRQQPLLNGIAAEDRLPLVYGKARLQCKAVTWYPVPGSEMIWLKAVIAVCEGEIEAIDHFYMNTAEYAVGDTTYYNQTQTKITHYHGVNGAGISNLFPPTADTTYFTDCAHIGLEMIGYASGAVMPWWYVPPGFTENQEIIFTVDVRGRKVYDPRTTTTAYSNNPALIARDLLVTYGHTPTAAIDDSGSSATSFYTAAATCDTNSFACNVAFSEGMTLKEALRIVLQTCCGELTYTDGKVGIYIDAANAGAALLTLNEQAGTIDNVNCEWLPVTERPTRVIVEFLNENANYVLDRTEAVEDPGVADGTVALREAVLQIDGVTTLTQACKLRDYYFNAKSIPLRITGQCGFQGVRLARGNKIHVETLAGIDADCCVEQATLNDGGFWSLVLKPYDADVYNSTPDTSAPPLPPPPPTTTPFDPEHPLVAPFGAKLEFELDGNGDPILPAVALLTFYPSIAYVDPPTYYTTSYWSQTGFATFDGTKINDNVTNVDAGSINSGTVAYLKFDAGVGATKTFGRCTIIFGTGHAWGFTNVEYSDNGTDWTAVAQVNGQDSYWLDSHLNSCSEWDTGVAGAHRYWRVSIDTDVYATTVREVQFYEVLADPDPRHIYYDIYASDSATGTIRSFLGTLESAPLASGAAGEPYTVTFVDMTPTVGATALLCAVTIKARTSFVEATYPNRAVVSDSVPGDSAVPGMILSQDPGSATVQQPVAANIQSIEAASVIVSAASNNPVIKGTNTTSGKIGIEAYAPTSSVNAGVAVLVAEDTTTMAADVGAGVLLRGKYKADGTTAGFGGVKAGKANATEANLDGYVDLYSRENTAGLLARVRIDKDGGVVLAKNGALATNATGGFTYLPSCAGTPSGTPTAYTGTVPLVYDTTNDCLYVYNSGWKKMGPQAELPSAYVEMTTQRTTTSATLEDITGASTSITLPYACNVAVFLNCEVSAASAAADIGLAVNIDGTDHDTVVTHLAAGSTDSGVSSVIHRTVSALTAGTYTVKGRMKRAAGSGTPAVDRADLFVMALKG